jgi:Holliday junction resolvase
MGAMSRRKGQRGELEVAELLRAHGFQAERGRQYSGSPDSPDVRHDIPGIFLEVKRTERFNLYAALEQAKQDRRPGDIPVVMHRQNGRGWVAVLPAAHLLVLLRELKRFAE